MHHPTWRTTLHGVLSTAMALALAACGGSNPPAATITATDDAATLDWRSSALVNVLANDSANRGSLSLASVEAPGHGTAVVEAGQLRYTPAEGWFGTDSVRYTVQSDAGGSAMATVTFTVQARLTLSGTITDAPIADAAVTVQVGDQTIEVTADGQGRYAADVVSASPDAWVQVAGVSPDGRVRLVSVIGALDEVAALADAESGAVAASMLPALNATHWTSAEAALRARALGGRLPASAEDMRTSDGAVRPQELQSLAIAVNLIADGGVTVPEGVADSFALLQDAAATQAFVRAQATGNAEAYAAAQQAVVNAAPAPGGEPWAVTATRVLTYSDGGNPVSYIDLTVELQPGGAGTVYEGGQRHAARWVADGPVLQVTLTSPIEQADFPCYDDPVTGFCVQYAAVYRTLGYRLQAVVGGSPVKRPVLLATRFEHVWLEGPLAGQSITTDPGGPGFLATVFDLAGRAGVGADELAVGARLAGVTSSTFDPTQGVRRQDILRIDGPGTGTFQVSGQAATWTLEDGWLTVHTQGMPSRRYTRLERDPLTGLESWVAASVPADVVDPVVYEGEQNLLFADAGLSFTADSAARLWRTEGYVQANPEYYGLDPSYVFNPDGTATGNAVSRWQLASDGTLELVRVYQGADYL
ncbi:MAG: cadherin-like domain-containing protein, partial [Rhodoferax sp.]|nr:cadherin-like domain-containing protein [Rhodoferax sp.]